MEVRRGKMRIVLDMTSSARKRRQGIANYSWGLVRGLAEVAPENEYVIAVRPNRWTKRKYLKSVLPGTHPRLTIDGLNWLLIGSPIDIFHGLGARLPKPGSFANIVTLHDINVFEHPEISGPEWREKRQRRIRQTLERADRVIVPSMQGAEALTQHLNVQKERIHVIPEAVDTNRFTKPDETVLGQAIAKFDLEGCRYILSIGEYSKRKNQAVLLRAFAEAAPGEEWILVFAGVRKKDGVRSIYEDAGRLGLPAERVRCLGWIHDDDLPSLIAGAALYCCPSLHEGFGIPVIEAQACGVAVIASNRGALPETVGKCGLCFDPENTSSIAEALSRMVTDDSMRERFAREGPERVRTTFTWDRVARKTLAVYEEALRHH